MNKTIYVENGKFCIVTKQKNQYKIVSYDKMDALDAWFHASHMHDETLNIDFFKAIKKYNADVAFVQLDDACVNKRIKAKNFIKESGTDSNSLEKIYALLSDNTCNDCVNCESCVLSCPPCGAASLCPMFNSKKTIYDESIRSVVKNAIGIYSKCFYTQSDLVRHLMDADINVDIILEAGYHYFALFEDPRPMRSHIDFFETMPEAQKKFEYMKQNVENEYEYKNSSITTNEKYCIERTGVNRYGEFAIRASCGFVLNLFD